MERGVKRIPSFESYLNSFAVPLIEEVHADIFSSLDGYAQASFIEVVHVAKLDDEKPIFGLEVAEPAKDEKSRQTYEPKECSVLKIGEDELPPSCCIVELSSALPIKLDPQTNIMKEPLFVVFLINMKTYNHIWKCLNMGSYDGNHVELQNTKSTDLVNKVWQCKRRAVKDAGSSCLQLSHCFPHRTVEGLGLEKFNINDSQLSAVADIISIMDGGSSVKLSWVPLGQVATRIVKLVSESSDGSIFFLNDIVLYGNKKRMRIENGWRHCLCSLIDLLENSVGIDENISWQGIGRQE
ncbi:hypothetical protein ACP4OV_011264 [Aristida adscensionis]